jgi:hypothetical protein
MTSFIPSTGSPGRPISPGPIRPHAQHDRVFYYLAVQRLEEDLPGILLEEAERRLGLED